jgi:hypothetical protein
MRIKERYQLAAELGERYWAAGRQERGEMLDALCLTTGYSRKYAISIRRGRQRMPRLRRKPRRRRYGKTFQTDLAVPWEAAGYICAERLGPFLLLPSSSDSAQSRPPLPWQRQPHIEQKNGYLVRRLLGNLRLDSAEQLAWLDGSTATSCGPSTTASSP